MESKGVSSLAIVTSIIFLFPYLTTGHQSQVVKLGVEPVLRPHSRNPFSTTSSRVPAEEYCGKDVTIRRNNAPFPQLLSQEDTPLIIRRILFCSLMPSIISVFLGIKCFFFANKKANSVIRIVHLTYFPSE